ncbi:MAG: translocation/assembly module TamB [Holosporales bacterium]|jgi:hypothetical protein|nr:translocation/assembly module TamB [Holosporales bacterium]
MKRFFVKRIGWSLCKFIIGGVLCLIIGIQTRYGHHVLYVLLSEAVAPYSISFSEEDFYLSLPTSIVIQRLMIKTPTGPCVVHGAFLKIDPLETCRKLVLFSPFSPLTHWIVPIPSELASCRIQKIEFPAFTKEITLQDVHFERKHAGILCMTIENRDHKATLKAKIEDTIRFAIDGDTSCGSAHLSHAKITGTIRPTSEAYTIAVQAAADHGVYRDVAFEAITFRSTIHVRDKTAIDFGETFLSLKSETFSGVFCGDVSYTDGHLSGDIELKNGSFPCVSHVHGRCHVRGTLEEIVLRITAAAKWQNKIWCLQSNAQILPKEGIEFKSGRLSSRATELMLSTPLYVPFSLSEMRGAFFLKTSDIGEIASYWDIPLTGQGAGTVQFIKKPKNLTVSFSVQGSPLHYNSTWSIGQCQVSGEVQNITEKCPYISLKGKGTDITTPYGAIKTCAIVLQPNGKKGDHAAELEIELGFTDPLHAIGTINFQKRSATINALHGNGLSIKKALHGAFTKRQFIFSGSMHIGTKGEISWKGRGNEKNFSLAADFQECNIPSFIFLPLSSTLRVSGTLDLKGLPHHPVGNATFSLFAKEGTPQDCCTIRTDFSHQCMRYAVYAQDRWGDFIEGDFSFLGPIDTDSIKKIQSKPFTGALRAQAKIGRLLRLFSVLPDDVFWDGYLKAALKGSGTLEAVMLSGALCVHDGLLELDSSGTAFHDIQIDCVAHGNRLSVRSASLRDRRAGHASATGFLEISSASHGASQQAFCDLHLNLQRLLIIGQDDLQVTALGPARLSGIFPKLSLTGTLTLSHIDFLITTPPVAEAGDLRITEIGPHKERRPFNKSSLYLPFLCSVKLPSPSVYVHGQSVESQWSGTLKLVGGLKDPIALEGELRLQNGYLDFCGRRLPFVRGKIVYTAQAPLEPAVHLRGHKIFSDLDVLLSVVTTPSKTYFQLTSLPDHSVEDILSILLFGKLSSELSSLEMVQLLHAASSFRGNVESPLRLLDTMRDFSGIDTITYNATEEVKTRAGEPSTRTLTLGKHLNSTIFLGIDNELDSNTTTFSIQMLLTPRTMLEAKTNGEFGISLRQPF